MKSKPPHVFNLLIMLCLVLTAPVRSYSQSPAANGQIEGTISNEQGSSLAGVVVVAENLQTGIVRTVTTSEVGLYRLLLLPIGVYRITAQLANYKKVVRDRVNLSVGQVLTIDLILPTGDINEAVIIAIDGPITDVGKTDLGRVLSNREVESLPSIARNVHNFALSQANVSGRPSRGLNFPIINANGFARRVTYQLDGNAASGTDRAGIRSLNISETYVNEVALTTNGFAAEFASTPGLIVNVATPSGTNDLNTELSYFFRVPRFYAKPFGYPTETVLPDNNSNVFTARVGGPVIKERWHYYAGYEFQSRRDNTRANRLVRITQDDRSQLIASGLDPSIFPASIPNLETASYYLLRTDAQLNPNNHFTARFNHFSSLVENNIQGGFNTLDRSIDIAPSDHTFAIQLASYTPKILNELRFQFVRQESAQKRNELSGSGPSVTIPNVANFGSPDNSGVTDPLEKNVQMQDNFTLMAGKHAFKFGGGALFVDHFERAAIFSRYTFGSIDAYRQARSGQDPFSYVSFEQTFGDPDTRYRSQFLNFFVQDDWKAGKTFKVNLGIRYDLYIVPHANPSSPFPASRKFNVDKNNFAPRIGAAFALTESDRPLVLRLASGIYFESPWLDMYAAALLRNGLPKFTSIRLGPLGAIGSPRPAFPASLPAPPSGNASFSRDIYTVATDLENMNAIHTSLQLEKALNNDSSISIGYMHSAGRHLPVYRNINLINPKGFLSDGRGIYDPSVRSQSRLDSRFNGVYMVEAAGVSQYDALMSKFSRRFSHGFQFETVYTLSRSVDDAPEQNLFNAPATVLSDPNNRTLDRSYSYADQRHTFNFTFIARPEFRTRNHFTGALLNQSQFAVSSYANSGERYNIVSDLDLNNDGLIGAGVTNSDRPINVPRNSGRTPSQFNLDFRYSRFVRFGERVRAEFLAEFQNLFNVNSIVQFNNVVVGTNKQGVLLAPLPDFRSRANNAISQESRQFQIGVKVRFN